MAAYRPGFDLKCATSFTDALNIPVICVGGLSIRETLLQALENGYCDMVSVARGHIADPYLFTHLKYNQKGPECDYCNLCFTRAGVEPLACLNTQVREERRIMLEAHTLTEAQSSAEPHVIQKTN